MTVVVEDAPFDFGVLSGEFAARAGGAGAVVTFLGIVRNDGDDLERMEIEHYPGMTATAIAAIEAEAVARWNLTASFVLHRYGALAPGAPIMMVATAARHRAEAFAAAEFLMDFLKSRAPFWKKEIRAGGAAWVPAKCADEAALARWNSKK